MSLTPSTPELIGRAKDFWKRPEGKLGIAALSVASIFGCFLGYWILTSIPWALIFTNFLYMCGTALGIVILLVLALSKSIHAMIDNYFRNTMRATARLLFKNRGLEIIKNTIDMMIEKKSEYDEAVGGMRGAKITVEKQMADNVTEIDHCKTRATEFGKEAAKSTDQLRRENMMLRQRSQLAEAGRRIDSNKRLQKVADQNNRLYNWLVRLQSFLEYKIDDTKLQYQGLKAERETILKAFEGASLARRIMQGDPEQLQLNDMAIENLIADNNEKLGFVEDFGRVTQKYLDLQDVDQAVQAGEAEKMFAELEQKMLVSPTEKVPLQMGTVSAEDITAIGAIGAQKRVNDQVDYLGLDQK